VVELGRLAGWSPLPLSVRDARRVAPGLRERLSAATPPRPQTESGTALAASARNLTVAYGNQVAVREVSFAQRSGQITALMGRNGSGKSTLLWALQGGVKRRSGVVDVGGSDPATLPAHRARRLVGLVPQTPADLLYLTTVDSECAQADREAGAAPGTCRGLLDRFAPTISGALHPADLSEGQRLALVLAIQLTAAPPLVLLDEPTRGLDYTAKDRLGRTLRELAGAGHSVLVATHDVEFVAATADRVVVLAEGEVVADGPTDEVVVSSPAFAPQVAKILAPQPWLTVAQVAAALQGASP
jgi:energy-coupling factor transport system ATP-binding protein